MRIPVHFLADPQKYLIKSQSGEINPALALLFKESLNRSVPDCIHCGIYDFPAAAISINDGS